MSIYAVNKLCRDALHDVAFREALKRDPAATTARLSLSEEERTALLAGDVGTGPGTGQFVCTAQQLPVAPVITSNNDCADRPNFSASTKASPTAICCTASTMLLHSFAACPVPESPQ